MATFWDTLLGGPAKLIGAGLGNLIGNAARSGSVNPLTLGPSALFVNRGGKQQSAGGTAAPLPAVEGIPVGMSFEETVQYLKDFWGYDDATAAAVAASGGGGRGFGGGGGGGGAVFSTAARDAALANLGSTYATAAATFQGSEDEYRKIHGDERAETEGATKNASQGTDEAYRAALASRAAERKALGIEDAASVGVDTVENEKKIATDNTARTDTRMANRAQGHLDNNLEFNTNLKAVVEMEGKEKQKEIADYYAGQLAQIAARRGGGGGGGGGYRSSGGRSSSGGRMTDNQLGNMAWKYMTYEKQMLDAIHGPRYREGRLAQTAAANPTWTPNQQLARTKYVDRDGPLGYWL